MNAAETNTTIEAIKSILVNQIGDTSDLNETAETIKKDCEMGPVKVISWTAGNGDQITLGIKSGSYEAAIFTSGGYEHEGCLTEAKGLEKKAGAVMKLGRVGIKASEWDKIKDYYIAFDIEAAARELEGKVEVFVGDMYVLMDKLEAAEYRGF